MNAPMVPEIAIIIERAVVAHARGDADRASALASIAANQILVAGMPHDAVVRLCRRLALVDFDLAVRVRDRLFCWEGGQPL